ncbi:dynamin family protein [Breznakiellaceae bacterium SP9]
MVTQIALYNALMKSLDENRVDEDSIDSIKAALDNLGTLSGKIEESKGVLGKLISSQDSVVRVYQKINEIVENVDPVIATGIYELCRRLKGDIDVFENQILAFLPQEDKISLGAYFHGSRSKERVNVFLLGEFSAGKTTFVKRLISDLSGPTAGGPATACLVVHKQGKMQSLAVSFNSEINVENQDQFESFLNSNDLVKYFELVNNKWKSLETEITFDSLSGSAILDFLNEANGFPQAFNKITWNHKKSGRNTSKNTFLDFVDLYDMPGIGGYATHTSVIETVFKKHKPDIILYLVDTARGSPSEVEANELKELLHYILKYDSVPLFFWVYQKPSGSYDPIVIECLDKSDCDVLSEKFITDKKHDIENFIQELAKGNDRIGPFPKEYIDYLSRSSILDARGLSDDTEMAQDSVSLALRDHFCINARKYIEKAREIFTSDKEMPQDTVMTFVPSLNMMYSDNNPFIEEKIISSIKSSSDMSIDNVKKIFLEAFCIKEHEDFSMYPFDLKSTFEQWEHEVNKTINKMLKPIKYLFRNKISKDKIDDKFWMKYKKNKKWQKVLFTVQAFHWVKASYDERVMAHCINKIGIAVLNNIEKGINTLEGGKILLPVCMALGDVNDDEK